MESIKFLDKYGIILTPLVEFERCEVIDELDTYEPLNLGLYCLTTPKTNDTENHYYFSSKEDLQNYLQEESPDLFNVSSV